MLREDVLHYWGAGKNCRGDEVKTYACSIDWAKVAKKCGRIIWHNDPTQGGAFSVLEDVNKIKD